MKKLINRASAWVATLALLLNLSCMPTEQSSLVKTSFGEIDDQPVALYTIGFANGLKAEVSTYGLILTSLLVPDKHGNMGDIVLGYDHLEGYLEASPYFGSIVGRYGNRIDSGRFSLNGKAYTLAQNNGPNHLHGGIKGFDKVIWEVTDTYKTSDSIGITFQYVSPDGEEGYPGTLTTKVTYTFTPSSWRIDYLATTDAFPTVVNLTQHAYFNLSGNPARDILDHELMLKASHFLPVDSTLIPTGELRPVHGTPFNFTQPKPIGKDIEVINQQMQYGGGYDHCWAFDGGITSEPRNVGTLYHPGSGRLMEILTTEPGVQFYTGNFLDGTITGKEDIVYKYRSAVCLETQHYPDSPNQPDFPSVVLNPGEKYQTTTQYNFKVR